MKSLLKSPIFFGAGAIVALVGYLYFQVQAKERTIRGLQAEIDSLCVVRVDTIPGKTVYIPGEIVEVPYPVKGDTVFIPGAVIHHIEHDTVYPDIQYVELDTLDEFAHVWTQYWLPPINCWRYKADYFIPYRIKTETIIRVPEWTFDVGLYGWSNQFGLMAGISRKKIGGFVTVNNSGLAVGFKLKGVLR